MLNGFSKETEAIRILVKQLELKTIKHSNYQRNFDRIAEAMQYEPDDSIIAVVGPSGSGKTALAHSLKSEINGYFASIGKKAGTVPALIIEAMAPEASLFRWRPLYLQWLDALHEPFLNAKTDIAAELRSLRENGTPVKGLLAETQALGILRQVLEKAVVSRENYASIIDEAHHLAKVGGNTSLINQMDLLKSLANSIKTRLVLVGTGEMVQLLDQSAQLSRRVVTIYFEPYRYHQQDLKNFGNGILGVLNVGPLPHNIKLPQNLDFLWNGCLGLFGVGCTWIRRGFAHALRRGSSHLTKDDLQSTLFEQRTLIMLKSEIEVCDRFFSPDRKTKPKDGGSAPTSKKKAENSPKRRVGKRKPHRDPVGTATTTAA